MTVRTNRRRWATMCLLAGLGVLGGTLPAGAQLQGLSTGSLGLSGSGTTGNGSGGGNGGTSGSGASGSISGGTGTSGTTGTRTGTTGMTGTTRPTGTTTGTTTTGRTGRAGTVTTGPSSSNPFRGYYVSPLSSGLVITTAGTNNPTTAQTTSVPAFGQPAYQSTTATTTTTTTAGTTTQSQAIGFSTVGQDRVPAYVTVVGFDAPPRLPAPAVRTDLQASLSRLPRFQGGDSVQVAMEGQVVVLRGEVNRNEDRRLAEAMVRLTPGVREVRNELQVRNPPPKQP